MKRLLGVRLRQWSPSVSSRRVGNVALLAAVFLLLSTPQASDSAFQSQDRERSIAEIVKSSIDAVVLVVVSDAAGKEVGQGSGFIISPDGKIVTNYHVIEGADSAIVKLSNGAFFPVDGVLATSKDDDLAVIKVFGRNLPFLPFGDSEKLSIGDRVIAIGSPLGLQNTVTDGIVSALRDDSKGRNWIQTTAPASPGNSGGPLLNLEGDVVGVITFGAKVGQNLNFAAPINAAKSLLASSHDVVPLDTQTLSKAVRSRRPIRGRIWTSMTSGHDYKVRFDGDYIYTEWVNLPRKHRETPAFARSEFKKQGDIWVGKGRAYFPCQYTVWTGEVRYNWCRDEGDVEITSISESRIEGRARVPVEYDCKKCRPKKEEWKPFSWIPKD